MRNVLTSFAGLLLAGCATGALAETNRLQGDYVEARTAAVFAGPCHYNGEYTTSGRDAVMAWRIREGYWNGVRLDGLNVMAAVGAEDNLSIEKAARHSILYIDSKATDAQAKALEAALREKAGHSLGTVLAVKRTPIVFTRKDEVFLVEAKGAGKLSVEAMPDRACCKMPQNVWYKPLVSLKDSRVGFTRASGVEDRAIGTQWSKSGDNTALYGKFTL